MTGKVEPNLIAARAVIFQSMAWALAKLREQHLFFCHVALSFAFLRCMSSMTVTDIQGEYAEKLKGHLKSDDFFGVATHPEATLDFTSVEAKGTGLYAVTGDFKIKGKTNPATFDLQISVGEATAKVIIDRSLYGIRYGSTSFFDNLGNKAIYNDFELDVTLKL